MTESPNGPPLFRPVPVRPFNVNNINLKERAPSGDESIPHTPQTGSSLNLDWLNFKLLDPRNRVRSESSASISRAQSVMNLTSSTLMGIYEPTTYDNDKYIPGNDLHTPWGTGAETPARGLSMDEPTYSTQIGRAYPARRRSSAHIPPPISTTASIFYSGLRALLLSGLGVLYGIGVATVRSSRSAEAFRMEHMITASGYGWGYMVFWGASGLSLGCLLPYVDSIWERSFEDDSNGDAVETEGDATKNLRRNTDWALAVRGMGIFIGIAYAIRKLPWDSTLQVSLSLALVNPALWFLIDGSMPGFIVSSVVGFAGSALLTGLQPDMVPVPAMLSSSSVGGLYSTGAVPSNTSASYTDTQSTVLGGLASQQTLAIGIWTLNVLFCCCVVFGNVGRWLAINKYGPRHVPRQGHTCPNVCCCTYLGPNPSGDAGGTDSTDTIHASVSQPSLPSSMPLDDEDLPVIVPADGTGNIAAPNPTGTESPGNLADLLLDAVKDARQIIRLVQCQICNNILQHPTTLPCGHSICRACLPETRPRANISWPAVASRLQGFDCPFPDCGKEHAVADCALDVTLNKVIAVIKAAVASHQSTTELLSCSTHITVRDQWGVAGLPSLEERHPESRVLKGGRILATYALAQLGKLEYSSEVTYSAVGAEEEVNKLDAGVFLELKESVKSEMDCQVCYALFLDPMTTTCGHTYCRTCIHRILDHSDLCPICRRTISIRAQADPRTAPSNGRLVSILNGFWADLIALRSQAYILEQRANHEGLDVPVFVCTLSFPSMPLFLHVFEPRYRLMIRRAMEGDRTFGMVLGRPVLSSGDPGFVELGVLLRIVRIEFFQDGRSLLEAVGVSRFRITRHGFLDGYVVANIEKVDDISLAEEEALEASDLGRGSDTALLEERDSANVELPSIAQSSPTTILPDDLDSISTRELVSFGVDFVRRMQEQSVEWLTARMLAIYGECPENPATFPWWFACVFPVSDAEKYKLLGTSSVRERLKMCYRWIVEWEASRVRICRTLPHPPPSIF
ncbi:insulin-induced protein-domain-containing protein [Nemania abortiva]|nr:insulin-induced protein-domain-containing protein [Nemania abortiva]